MLLVDIAQSEITFKWWIPSCLEIAVSLKSQPYIVRRWMVGQGFLPTVNLVQSYQRANFSSLIKYFWCSSRKMCSNCRVKEKKRLLKLNILDKGVQLPRNAGGKLKNNLDLNKANKPHFEVLRINHSNQTGISVSRFLPNSILWEKVIECRTITVKIKYAQKEKMLFKRGLAHSAWEQHLKTSSIILPPFLRIWQDTVWICNFFEELWCFWVASIFVWVIPVKYNRNYENHPR